MSMKYLSIIWLLFACFACDSSIDKENLEQTPSKIYLSKSGLIVHSIFDFGEAETSYDLYINKSGYIDRAANIALSYDPSVLEESGVDLDVTKAFPSSVISFDNGTIRMEEGQTLLKNSLTINLNEVRTLVAQNPSLTYVIPIRLTVPEDNYVVVNNLKNTLLLEVEMIDPIVRLKNKGILTEYIFNPFKQPEIKELSLPIELSLPFKNTEYDFTFTLLVDPALVDAFNQKEGTDYEILPEGSYSIPEMKIAAGEDDINTNITVMINNLRLLQGGNNYLLPVKVTTSGNSDIPIEKDAIAYYKIKQVSKWTGKWDNTIFSGETGLSTVSGTTYNTALYSRIDALEQLKESTLLTALTVITDNDAIICPGWSGTMFEQCSPIIKVTDQDTGDGKKKIEILATWAGGIAGSGSNIVANNKSTYDPIKNVIYLDYEGEFSWGTFHIKRAFSNQSLLE